MKYNQKINVLKCWQKTGPLFTKCFWRVLLNQLLAAFIFVPLVYVFLFDVNYHTGKDALLVIGFCMFIFLTVATFIEDISFQIIYDKSNDFCWSYFEQLKEVVIRIGKLLITKIFMLLVLALPFLYILINSVKLFTPEMQTIDYVLFALAELIVIILFTLMSVMSHGILFHEMKAVESIKNSFSIMSQNFLRVFPVYFFLQASVHVLSGVKILLPNLVSPGFLSLVMSVIAFIILGYKRTFVTLIFEEAMKVKYDAIKPKDDYNDCYM